jgi:hypothetical protein
MLCCSLSAWAWSLLLPSEEWNRLRRNKIRRAVRAAIHRPPEAVE